MFPDREDPFLILADSLIGGGAGDAILRQEKRGQDKLVNSEVLPRKYNSGTRQQFEQMGIVFGENADDLFVYVTLPAGWSKQPTDHSMWSKLVDDKGRERASIFFKAAFYDRDAFLSISRRYGCSSRPVRGYDDPDYRLGGWVGVVNDGKQEIWQSPELGPEPDSNKDRPAWLKWYQDKEALGDQARQWLATNYPDWENPLAYWD